MIRLIVADDHAIVREGMKRLIEAEADMAVIAEAADGAQALQCLREHAADVLVLDLSMPGRNGIELIKHIRDAWPRLPILILTMHEEQQYALRSIRAGARGYLTKDTAGAQLVQAIRRLNDGRMFISDEVAELLAINSANPGQDAPHTRLSDREHAVFQLLIDGRSVSEIGNLLHISVKTASTHKTRILEKMQAGSVVDLVRYAVEHRLMR
jgi:DNA-binding NarL/FixJ family response regulator